MTELEQFTADSHTAPHRVVLDHLQNQLLKLGIEAWPPGARDGDRKLPTSSSPARDANPESSLAGPTCRPELHGSLSGSARPMIVRSAAFSRGLFQPEKWLRIRSRSQSRDFSIRSSIAQIVSHHLTLISSSSSASR